MCTTRTMPRVCRSGGEKEKTEEIVSFYERTGCILSIVCDKKILWFFRIGM